MSLNFLTERFRQIADKEGAIPYLRRIAVALAVTGRLDDARDESWRSVLEASRKAAANARAGRRFSQGSVDIAPEELPRGFKNSVRFARLGELARIEKGLTGIQGALPGRFPLIVTASEHRDTDHFDFDGAAAIVPLVSSAGHGRAAINRLHFAEGQFALGSILAALFPWAPDRLSARFLYEYLSAFTDELLVSRMIGTANVTLTVGKLAEVPVPLVSPRSQKKLDELMTLCDQLDAARADRERRRDRLSRSTLNRLNFPRSGGPTDKADVQFALRSLPGITSRTGQIAEMRRTIRRLAIRGELCCQDSDDEPAGKLLDRIGAYRATSLACGYPNEDEARTQGRKQATQVLPKDLSALPNGWVWATLMQCSHIVIDCRNKTAPYVSSGIPLIRTTNVRDGKINATDLRFVDHPTYERWSSRSFPQPGDILITREAPMGEVCLIPDGMNICLGQRMMLVRLVPDTIDPSFMLCSLQDPDLMERVQDKPIGATVQHLRVGGVETLLVPLPPLAEQRRIVARVDELMTLCDQLEASLAAADTVNARLLDAILHEALNGPPQAQAA